MKTIQTKADELLLIKVPELAFYFDWKIKSDFESIIIYYETEDGKMGQIETDLLDWNKFEIIGKFSQLKDKDFEEFVFQWGQNMSRDIVNFCILGYSDIVKIDKNNNLCYKNYLDNFNNNYTLTPKESFISLCKSQGIEDDLDNYLIIKKL